MSKLPIDVDPQALLRSILESDEDDDTLRIHNFDEWVLYALLGKELYGLEIIAAIEKAQKELSSALKAPGIGTLYTSLHRLEQRKYVSSRMEERSPRESKVGARRKYYKITKLGMQQLDKADRIRKSLLAY